MRLLQRFYCRWNKEDIYHNNLRILKPSVVIFDHRCKETAFSQSSLLRWSPYENWLIRHLRAHEWKENVISQSEFSELRQSQRVGFCTRCKVIQGFPVAQSVKDHQCAGNTGSTSGSGCSPGERHTATPVFSPGGIQVEWGDRWATEPRVQKHLLPHVLVTQGRPAAWSTSGTRNSGEYGREGEAAGSGLEKGDQWTWVWKADKGLGKIISCEESV